MNFCAKQSLSINHHYRTVWLALFTDHQTPIATVPGERCVHLFVVLFITSTISPSTFHLSTLFTSPHSHPNYRSPIYSHHAHLLLYSSSPKARSAFVDLRSSRYTPSYLSPTLFVTTLCHLPLSPLSTTFQWRRPPLTSSIRHRIGSPFSTLASILKAIWLIEPSSIEQHSKFISSSLFIVSALSHIIMGPNFSN